jgi:hypothetical protein
MTIVGVLHAYWRARRQKILLDEIKSRSDSLEDPSLVEMFESGLSEDDRRTAELKNLAATNERELEQLLNEAGIDDPPPSWDDMRLPPSYWSRRAALADLLVQFRADGALALGGVLVSTIASVWSLYL